MEYLTPFVMYNWLQDSAIQKLIIDVRDPAMFDIGYIKTAINIPIPDDAPEDQELDLAALAETLTPKNRAFKSRGLVFSHLLVYDANGEGVPAKRLVRALMKEKKVQNVKLLQGGYQTFVVQYPFLSSTSTKKAVGGTYPSAIVDRFLFLGSHEHAKSKQQLKDLGISYIVNMAGELENEYPDDFKYLSVKLDDTSGDNITEHFERTLKFIEDANAANSKVLVHCAMGISRSSSIVIAYLMRVKGMSYEEAHQFVKSMRSCIKPNPGFMTQLVAFEKQIAETRKMNDLVNAAQAMHISQQAEQTAQLIQAQSTQETTHHVPLATLVSITESLATATPSVSSPIMPTTTSMPEPFTPAVPPPQPLVPSGEPPELRQNLVHIVEEENK